MVALLIAGIAAFLAGILALLFGIPIKEFSFGNTMIITGAVVASAGMLTIGMWVLAREMRTLAARVGVAAGPIATRDTGRSDLAPVLPPVSRPAPEPVIIGDITAPSAHDDDDAPPPLPKAAWPETEPSAAEPPPAPKPKRNLLFSSSSRKERERAAAKAAEDEAVAAPVDLPPPPPPFDPAAAASDIPDADPRDSFESAWPQAEVARPAASPRRREEPPMRPRPEKRPEPRPAPAPAPADVTVLKSGVVDGMAYSLYSDGSIEAQMPEGMVRFASIDDLRAHLDERG